VKEPADLRPAGTLDLLHREADLARGHPRRALLDEPQPMAVVDVPLPLPVEPGLRIRSRIDARVVPHDVVVREHRGHEVEVARLHLAEAQARRLEDGAHDRATGR
jgi:hypothetical protein